MGPDDHLEMYSREPLIERGHFNQKSRVKLSDASCGCQDDVGRFGIIERDAVDALLG